MASSNGYILYLLQLMAMQGGLASIYSDSEDLDGFIAGFVECVCARHVLVAEVTPWGMLDGWRVYRTTDIFQIIADEDYERRLMQLLVHYKQYHKNFLQAPIKEDENLLYHALVECMAQKLIISLHMGEELVTGRVAQVDELRVTLEVMDFFGGRAEESESFILRDVDVLSITTQEERMYGVLEQISSERLRLLPKDRSEDE